MPREIVHWHVVDELSGALEASEPVLAQVIRENRFAAYLGAIAHDAPYYYALGKSEAASHVAERLHGKDGEDTFAPLFRLLQRIDSRHDQWRNPLLAFVCGMISHAVVDMHFHPMIIYLTGDYYHPNSRHRRINRALHRIAEVQLDSYVRQYGKARCPLILSDILAQSGQVLSEASQLLAQELNQSSQFWSKAILDSAWCQRRFLQSRFGVLMCVLSWLWPSRFAEYEALFSFRRSDPPRYLCEPLCYRNPVSGKEYSHRIEELLQLSIAETARVLRHARSRDYSLQGGSLSFGIVGARTVDAKYFRER